MVCSRDVTFHRPHIGLGASCHPVSSKWYDVVEAAMAQVVLCLEKPKAYCIEKQSIGPQIALALFEIYLDKMASPMKCGAFLMYLVHAVRPNFIADSRHIPI